MVIIKQEVIEQLFPIRKLDNTLLKIVCFELINKKIIDPDNTFTEYEIDPTLVSFNFSHPLIKKYTHCVICGCARSNVNCYITQPSLDYRETMDEMNLRIKDYRNHMNYFPSCGGCVPYAHLLSPKMKSIMLNGFTDEQRNKIRKDVCGREICSDIANNITKEDFTKLCKYFERRCHNREISNLFI